MHKTKEEPTGCCRDCKYCEVAWALMNSLLLMLNIQKEEFGRPCSSEEAARGVPGVKELI
jgi:hypothetical protein